MADKEQTDFWVKLLSSGAVIALVAGFFKILEKPLQDFLANRRNRKFSAEYQALENEVDRQIAATFKAQALIHDFTYVHLAGRCTINRVHNGGELLRVGSPKKVSVMLEAPRTLEPIKSKFQNYPATDDYLDALLQARADKQPVILVPEEDYPLGSPLREIYENVGVKMDILGYIGLRKRTTDGDIELIYIDVQWTKVITGAERNKILFEYGVLLTQLRKLVL